MLYLPFLFFSFLHSGLSTDPTEYRCFSEYCLDVKCSIPDIEMCYNETVALLLPSPDVCNCCESCLIFQEEGDACIVGSMGQAFPDHMCGKGLKCLDKVCVKMDSNEIDPLQNENSYKCIDGMCYCMVQEEGVAIFPFGMFPEEDLEKGEIMCGCSVSQYIAQKQTIRFLPFDGIYQPFARCLPNGQFDPLQCQERVCSCIDPQTGEYDETIAKVSILALGPGSPECFNAELYGHTKKYYRDCDKAMEILQRARDLVEAEGFQFLLPFKIDCEPDGNYSLSVGPEIRLRLRDLESSVIKHSRFLR